MAVKKCPECIDGKIIGFVRHHEEVDDCPTCANTGLKPDTRLREKIAQMFRDARHKSIMEMPTPEELANLLIGLVKAEAKREEMESIMIHILTIHENLDNSRIGDVEFRNMVMSYYRQVLKDKEER